MPCSVRSSRSAHNPEGWISLRIVCLLFQDQKTEPVSGGTGSVMLIQPFFQQS